MDVSIIIAALATAVSGLAAYISYQFRQQLADKDKQIARWQRVADSTTSTAQESLKALQTLAAKVERDMAAAEVAAAKLPARPRKSRGSTL